MTGLSSLACLYSPLGMSLPCPLTVSVDLNRVRENAEAIVEQAGVPIIAVVKADAYGLGASEVAGAIGDLVHSFYVFDAEEAIVARLWDIAGKRIVALNGSWQEAKDYLSQSIAPVVWTPERAGALRAARPILAIDTGQQRFSCPIGQLDQVRSAGDCHEAMTHAVTMRQVERFAEVAGGLCGYFLHAAGSALLDQPAARFDAVRPGLALYKGAVRVSAALVDARDSTGPAGYTGFVEPRFGVILAGYSSGLRPGPCVVNGQLRRVIEVGMQSAFVTIGAGDACGDEVVLLGGHDGVDESTVAAAWGSSQQEVLVRLTKLAPRKYCHG
jgi:alanine racemase